MPHPSHGPHLLGHAGTGRVTADEQKTRDARHDAAVTAPAGAPGGVTDPLETRWVEQARAGSEQAFAALVRRHQDRLYAVALRMTADPDDARDVVQETLVQAWQHLPAFRGEAAFSTWATRILINRCHNAARARRPTGPLPDDDTHAAMPRTPAAETLALVAHRREAVRRAVRALPPRPAGTARPHHVRRVHTRRDRAHPGHQRERREGAGPPCPARAGRRTAGVEVTTVPADHLPCGVPAADLLAQVTDGTPPRDPAHQRTCPHCRAALAEFTELWAPVHDLAAEEVRAPADLLQSVMAQIRDLARADWSAVLHDPTGRTRIAARVIGAVARLAAESVPHVTLALGDGRDASDVGDRKSVV